MDSEETCVSFIEDDSASLTDGTVSLQEKTGVEAGKHTYSKTSAFALFPAARNLEQILDALIF